MRDYRNLVAWKKAHQLTLSIYQVTRRFPIEERFGLTAQLRRASVSIGSNIAEGCGRESHADFARFLSIAAGSASEVQYQLELARDLGYPIPAFDRVSELAHEVKRILRSLITQARAHT